MKKIFLLFLFSFSLLFSETVFISSSVDRSYSTQYQCSVCTSHLNNNYLPYNVDVGIIGCSGAGLRVPANFNFVSCFENREYDVGSCTEDFNGINIYHCSVPYKEITSVTLNYKCGKFDIPINQRPFASDGITRMEIDPDTCEWIEPCIPPTDRTLSTYATSQECQNTVTNLSSIYPNLANSLYCHSCDPDSPVTMYQRTVTCLDGFSPVTKEDSGGALVCSPNENCNTQFPQLAINEQTLFYWNEPLDNTAECSQNLGYVQTAKQNCQTVSRCIKEKEQQCSRNEQVGSYVSPTDGIFHEDIPLVGSDIALHYQSGFFADETIAKGWSLSLHHQLLGDYLHMGNGKILNITSNRFVQNNTTLIILEGESYVFDGYNHHIQTKDTQTKNTLYSFAYNTNNKLLFITDSFNNITTLERVDGNISSIVSPNGQVNYLEVDANGDLISIKYEDNSNYIFSYDNHLMVSETEPNGNEFIHEFDENNKIIQVIDAELGVWSFSKDSNDYYDETTVHRAAGDVVTYKDYFLSNGTLVSQTILPSEDTVKTTTNVNGTQSETQMCGVTTSYTYKQEKDPLTNSKVLDTKTITMPSGLTQTTHYTLNYTYVNDTPVEKEYSQSTNGATTSILKNYTNKTTTITSAQGETATITYNSNFQLPVKVELPNLEAVIYEYDEQGRVLTQSIGERLTTYTYNERGNLSSITDPEGQQTNYTYDLKDRLVSITYPDNHTLNYSYDNNGNITLLTTPTPTEHTFEYNGVNKRTLFTSPLGSAISYVYDAQKRLTTITKASGKSIDYSYANGRLVAMQTPQNYTSYNYTCQNYLSDISSANESFHYTYDGTLLKTVTQEGMLNSTLAYTYNNNFLVSSLTYAEQTTDYVYDKDAKLIQSGDFTITRDTQNQTLTLFDTNYMQTSEFNTYGELRKQENDIYTIELLRNTNGKIVQKTETLKKQKSTTNTYEYDERGRLISSHTLSSQMYEDAEDETTQGWRVYDTTPEGATISNVYDNTKQSRVIKLEGDARNNGYVLDNINDNSKKAIEWSMNFSENFVVYVSVQTTKGHRYLYYTASNTDGGLSDNGSYIHHGLGADASDGSWKTFSRNLEADLKEFESDNELLSVNRFLIRGSGMVDDIKLLNNQSTELEHYSYDANGNRLEATVYGVSTTASYTLDDSLEVYGNSTYRYDEDGYLVEKTTPNDGETTYIYNTLGALIEVNSLKAHSDKWHIYDKTPDGASISTIYDEDKQSHVIEFKGDKTSNGYRIGYTGNTNPNSWNSTDTSLEWSMNFSESFVVYVSVQTSKGHRYLYYTASNTDRGLSDNGSYIHHGLGADANDGSWKTFSRNLEADLQEYESDNEFISVNGFLVRGSGRVDDISTVSAYGERTVYEDAEQLKESQILYHQNALNQRIAKEVNGVITEKYLWLNLTTLLAIYDKDDNLIQRFNYANNRMPISMTQNNQKYYLHYDQVGTLRFITDVNHNIIKEITYDTFGNILSDTNQNFTIPFGFAGGLHDRDTGLVHFGYREYDLKTGKWTAKDPIDFQGGDANLYGYVLGDPVNFIDPEGLEVAVSGSLGVGGGVHVGIAGINGHIQIKTINGREFKVITICGRIGLGLYFGGGLEFSTGIEDDCQKSGWSGGAGADVAYGPLGGGASASGNDAGASATVGARIPNSSFGLGVSGGIDGCYSWVVPL